MSSPSSQRPKVESLSRLASDLDRTVTGAEGQRTLLQGQVADVEERRSSAESLQETLSQASAVLQELEQVHVFRIVAKVVEAANLAVTFHVGLPGQNENSHRPFPGRKR